MSRPGAGPRPGWPPELRVVEDVAEEALRVFLAERPRVVLLSGGETPRRLYRLLARTEYPWAEVECFFGDERCVPAHSGLSNARMAREEFLDLVPARAHPIDGARCDAEGYEALLRRRFGDRLLFELALYGLGPDGHTASLFPGRPEVEVTDRWVVRVPEPGWPPRVPRVSLTLRALSAARVGLLLVAGPDKREALRALLAGEDVPAARLPPGRLVVVADREALPPTGPPPRAGPAPPRT
ncbi:MAG TPA: 6-phosphogluconolactonase [Actinomycetota bacterium]|nr:6-phosphogluconolactonase [Actinomycetota bacterium]